MDARISQRGDGLTGAGAWLAGGSGRIAQIWAGGFAKVLDRIDAGLMTGAIHARLPDGTRRVLGGRAPGFECQVDLKAWRALARLATLGSVGWYQAWEANEWDSPDPVPLFALFMANAATLGQSARPSGPWRWFGRALHWLNRNSRQGARRNIQAHYDLGNDFYAAWLDDTLIYSSAMFAEKGDAAPALATAEQFQSPLSRAQIRKVAELARRLDLQPHQRLLEIGAGWGTLAAGMAQDFEVDVVALSLSDEQIAFAKERWSALAAGSFDYRKQDYRDIAEQFDAIVSVEMVEAVGEEYWPDFFDCLDRNLKPGGRAVLQYISIDDRLFPAYSRGLDFIQTYIFPGGMLISENAFRKLASARNLAWTDQRDFGRDYAETLRLWRANFDQAVADRRLPDGFDERFVRLWRYYLMYCEGGFRGGGINVSQVTLIKPA